MSAKRLSYAPGGGAGFFGVGANGGAAANTGGRGLNAGFAGGSGKAIVEDCE